MALNPRVKSLAVFGAKLAVAAGLVGWLIRSGVLKMGALSIFVERPILLVADLTLFAFAVMTGTLRWRALLKLAGAKIPLGRAIQLQLTALFFNVVIPGNVGGDVVKALYVAREEEPSKRTAILLIVFVERLVGMGGLVLVATCVGVLKGPLLWQNPQLRQLAMAVGFLGACTLVGPALFVLAMRRAGDRLEAWTSGTTVIAKLAGRLVAAARLLSAGPKQLVIALSLSMLAHAGAMTFFTVLTRVITEQEVPFSSVATVFPLGILTMILPISPAGLGVGHVAFDRLFSMIGLPDGATVFNVYVIGQLAPCLLGVFPYLALKRSGKLPGEGDDQGGGSR
jgi:glycosyltransferase 2 family protein